MLFCASYAQKQPPELKFNRVLPPTGKQFIHITAIAQDKLGYMWFASKNGLYRYNGYEMIHYRYDPLDSNSIPNNQLESLCIDTTGNIWIGSLGEGLFKFDPVHQKFTTYRHNNTDSGSLASNWISALLTDNKGNVWVGTNNGLDRYDAATNTFVHYQSNPADLKSLTSNEVVALYGDRKGTLWIGTGSVYGVNNTDPRFGGLNRMDDIKGSFTRFVHNPSDESSLINNKVRSMYEGRDGTFWVGTAGDGLHIMDRTTGKFQRLTMGSPHRLGIHRPPTTGDPYSMISFITEDAKGALWIGTTDNGLLYFDPATKRMLHLFPGETEVPYGNLNPWTAFTSAEGMMWISTFSGDLFTYNPLNIKIPFHQVETGEINGIYEHSDGSVWVGTQDRGLVHLDKDRRVVQTFMHEPGNTGSLSTNRLIEVTSDRNGDLWIGTLGYGVEKFSMRTKKIVKRYTSKSTSNYSLTNDTIVRISEDDDGNMWVGTFRGANLINTKTGEISNYIIYPTDTARFGKNLVSSIMQDRSNRCWMGTFVGGGLHILDKKTGKFKNYLQGISIANILEDSQGRLWAAGVEGLFYYNNERDDFIRFNDPLGLIPIADVRSVEEDSDKNIWISTGNGLQKISKNLDLVTSYDSHFGIDEELIYGSSHKGKSGNMYFSAFNGFYEVPRADFNTESKPPQIILSNFRLSNQTILPGKNSVLAEDISITDRIELKYNQNIFSFDFTAVDYVDPQANRHLFMLENYDETWNVSGNDRRAIYFNVPPGKYIFRVRAVNTYGKWAEKAVTVEIVPAWWSSWWFRVIAIITVIAIIYLLIRWRLSEKYRLQMERSEKEKELSRLQHRTTQLEMHALRAQMNPHFLFNSLNSINRFIIQNNSEQASGYLTKFSRLMRHILQNSQYELIPLENELEALRLYLELEAVRFDHHFTWTIKIDEHLDVSALKVPPLIIQPYAENAIWHGLMHKEEKGKLLVELKEEGEYLVCSITDDGIGRNKAAELKSKSASTHKSMGMKITADRIASMKKRKSNENNILITDLVLPNGEPAGTRVEIKIALQYD